MATRRSVLGGMAALPFATVGLAAEPGLGQIAESGGRFFGSALTSFAAAGDSDYDRLLRAECDVWVPEWQLKWGALTPTLDAPVDWTVIDGLVATAVAQGKRLRGHTLIWHEHLPAGVVDLDSKADWERVVAPHITAVATRYRETFFQWDVVNEAIEPQDREPDGMRRTPFYRMLGRDYVGEAFRLAHAAAPAARLYLNDYAVCYAESWQERRRTGVLKLLERLLKQGVPVHGFGIQGHLDTRFRFEAKRFAAFLNELRGLGLELAITELDVREADKSGGLDLGTRQQRAADEVRKVMSVALDCPAVGGIVTWGLADSESWLRSSQGLPDNQGLPYDDQLQPTPMRAALAELLSKANPHG